MSFEGVPNSKLDAAIAEWIHSERDRRIARRRFIDGITHESIAEEFDLSVRHVKTIIARVKKCIYNAL
jgi:DNA-directed RNA polymerase specialized sigma24 family protein